jgi:hypothetical protein
MTPVSDRARRSYPFLPAVTSPGVHVGPTGEHVRVEADGRVEELLPGGWPRPGIASDPDAGRTP